MIEASHEVIVRATPLAVYKHLEEREAKFPIYRSLDSRPFMALRLTLIGEPRTGLKMLLYGHEYFRAQGNQQKIIEVGESYGPFKLIEAAPGQKYWFQLRTRLSLFDLETGYLFEPVGDETLLQLSLISSQPNSLQRFYWRLVSPMHNILAKKVLSSIKAEVEAGALERNNLPG